LNPGKPRIGWAKTSRWPHPPLWVIGVVVSWGLFLALQFLFDHYFRAQGETCPFHWLTGHSCATCGSTRAVLALFQGQVLKALWYNPLVTGIILASGLLSLLRLTTGRSLTFKLKPLERWILGILAVLAFFGNWIWVLRTLG